MNLINKKLLQLKIATHEFPDSEKMANARKLLEGWQKALKDSDLEKTKEKSVQGKFLSTFFEAILGYSDVTTGNEEWTLIQHPRIENDSKEPDGSLGWFTKDKKITRAVIELKDAKTQLDKKQNRGSEKLTPIEQAYLYATKYDGCNWIIVSNFREIRLYNKHKTQEYYEKFEVVDLVEESEFKRFYFLLSKDTLLAKDAESITDVLAKDTLEAEQDITKKFYAEYKQVRLNLFQHLIENNESIEKEVLLEKAQKLLDRFIFTLFCEDTSSLLPLNIVKTTYERALNSLSPSDERVWGEFKGLFIAIDKGNDRVSPPINAYNGGLFAFDEILDKLSVKDEFWPQIMRLSEYDFETDLNVNILGHIFEQSISDLEEMKNAIFTINTRVNPGVQDPGVQGPGVQSIGKRKKDGIYYTPEYITRYIVENTVGKYLEENPDKLSTIKILDPACGSGAFLNQAHSFLSNEYKVRHDALIAEKQSKGEAQTLFDYNPAENNRAILLNNLYGVDLNQESVEITKLALWLKTARKTEPLQNLDKNIKCGNSLIDDPEVAGEKAFNWNNEFSGNVFLDKEVKAFLITWVTHNSRFAGRMKDYVDEIGNAVVLDTQSRSMIAQFLNEKIEKKGNMVLAMNVLSDHVHVVVVCSEDEIPDIVRHLKGYSARMYWKWRRSTHMNTGSHALNTRVNPGVQEEYPDVQEEYPDVQEEHPGVQTETPPSTDRYADGTVDHTWAADYNFSYLDSVEKYQNAINYVLTNHQKHEIEALPEALLTKNCVGEEIAFTQYSGGFDIVIGNPPYVRQELIKEFKPYLEKNYKTYTGISDLYVYFFEKGLNLLKDGGYFAFIVSDKFTRANYGRPLRKWLSENFTIVEYVKSFGEQVFEGVTVDPCIIIIKKDTPKSDSKVKVTDFNSMVEIKSFSMNQSELTEEPWNFVDDEVFKLKAKIESKGTRIKGLKGIQIRRGLLTGFNEAFIIDEAKRNELVAKDPKSAEIIKPLLRGRDLKRYSYEHAGLYIIGTFPALKVDIENYPAIKEHLLSFGKERLEQSGLNGARKKTGNKWFETQDQIAYWQDFEKPKILYPVIVSGHGFVLDLEGYYCNDKIFFIVGSEILSLTAILNSALGKFLARQYCVPLGESGFEYRKIFIEQIPIALPSSEKKIVLENLVEEITKLTKNLIKTEKSVISLLIANFGLKKEISLELGFNELLDQMSKQKVKLSLEQKEELQTWYKNKQIEINEIKKRINEVDRKIDELVYKLYGLSRDEIGVIERDL